MKILAISHEFPPIGGGGANACYFLTKGFVERGHEVTLITANYQGMSESETINGVRVIRVDSKRAHKEHCSFKEMLSYLLKAYPVANKLQKREKFDVCLVFFGIPSGPIGYMLKKKYKLPYVIRFGGGDVPGFQERFTKVYKIIAPAIKLIWKNTDALIANSQGLKDMALDFYDKNPFDIIPNGVDTDVFFPVEREAGEEFRILFVSRLIERKGLQFVIPQLKEIQSSTDKKIKLIVVGDGPYRETLEQIAKDNQVYDMIDFVGQKDKSEIVTYYQNADLFILPSAKEGMPNVVLEAMACGLPIIMTPCEGSTELICENGYKAERKEFADYIIKLIEDNEMRKEMSINSNKRVKKIFSWEHVVNEYLETLDGLLK